MYDKNEPIKDMYYPDNAPKTFRNVFPNDNNLGKLKIEQSSIINFTMYYIAKTYNERVDNMFDYDEILCYPFQKEMEIRYKDQRDDFNKKKFEPEKYYREIEEDVIEPTYQKLKDYIFKYIGKHDNSINVPIEKINAEMVSMSNGYFRSSLEYIYMYDLEHYIYDKDLPAGRGWSISEILVDAGIPFIYCDCRDPEECITAKYMIATEQYTVKLLAQIAEKLYYFILAEVKRVLEDKGIVDPNIKPVEGVDIPQQQAVLPQQLVGWDEAYVQQIMNNVMQQPYATQQPQSNIYMTDSIPINVEPDVPEPINPDMFGFAKATDVLDNRKVLSIEELQRRVDAESQYAATNEGQDDLEISPDVINLYNALDTYNRTLVVLFVRVMLKNKNSVQ